MPDVCMIHAMLWRYSAMLRCFNDAVRLHVVSMHNLLCCCRVALPYCEAALLFWRWCAITCCFDAQRSLLLPCCATLLRGCATFLAMLCDHMLFRCTTCFVVTMWRYPAARLCYVVSMLCYVVAMLYYFVATPLRCCDAKLRYVFGM